MQLVEFSDSHIDDAAALFRAAYDVEREHCEHLPQTPMGSDDVLRDQIATLAQNGGVAVTDGPRLLGYMLTGHRFAFKGQQAALTPEIGHAAAGDLTAEVYPLMYTSIGAAWSQRQAALHLIGYLAHDDALHRTLSGLGFGQILFERLRDLSPIPRGADVEFIRLDEPARLAEIETEHRRYYRGSPIFLNRPCDPASISQRLDGLREHGCVFFVYCRDDEPVAYFAVGPSTTDGEGLLVRNTRTAAIHSAFVRAEFRGAGIGTALLNAAIAYAADAGFDRLFVEHESANLLGSRFWGRHFTPFVRFSMRFVHLGEAD